MSADGGGTAITPAAVLDLRDEIAALKRSAAAQSAKLRILEARLAELEANHNDLDNRQDEVEHRLDGMESVQAQLMSGVTTGNLMGERTERHIKTVMAWFKIPETA